MNACLLFGCGKKGPPLPPLLKVPTPPADFIVERRGADVKVQLTVPAANTDGSKPANIERVDVYRFTGPAAATDDQLVKFGTKVASLPVKAPRDPDVTTEPDEPEEEPDLRGEGLDQGSTTELEDRLDSTAFTPVDVSRLDRSVRARKADDAGPRPLVGPPQTGASTVYAAVGVNKRGRRGPFTGRQTVSLAPPPKPPASPRIEYDETTIHVTWTDPASDESAPRRDPDILPSRAIGFPITTFGYHIYDVSSSSQRDPATKTTPSKGEVRLTSRPVSESRFDDTRIAWGAMRCYTVRTVATNAGLSVESDAPPPTCETLKDTFPPAPPRDLRAVSSERAVSLIWEPNNEKDLAGYIVLRGVAGHEVLDRLTAAPIQLSAFDDRMVQPGTHYVYAIQAIDSAGNVSGMSNRAEEIAR